jgi:cystathionine beta-synthase
MYYNSILETIGNTPIVKLNSLARGIPGTILVKVEYFNPGGSVKDRIARRMLEEAEKSGALQPGGTLVEGTSGNTGLGLAMFAIHRGYKAIFTMQDKQSLEKQNMLRAFGAEVVTCPTGVSPEDPRSYYSVSERLTKSIPGAFHPNQYANPNNPLSHYEDTGPEIYRQLEGKIDVFVAGLGTGGTITGIGKYLKEKNPQIQVVGADPIGSLYHEYKSTGKLTSPPKTYLTEGVGEDFLPTTVDFQYIDEVLQFSDRDAMLMTRRLAREEALFCGGSSGAAVHVGLEWAKKNLKEGQVMLILLPDHGSRALSKVFNDEWMQKNGMFEPRTSILAEDLVARKETKESLHSLNPEDHLEKALQLIRETGFSQFPIFIEGMLVGTLEEGKIIPYVVRKVDLQTIRIREVMTRPLPVVSPNANLVEISKQLSDSPAVLVGSPSKVIGILTCYDLLHQSTEKKL